MLIEPTPLNGAFILEPTTRGDERGWFSRVFCARTFREHGLADVFVQANHSRSELVGTVRGLHYQLPPSAEIKLARCTRGEVFDVFVDLRRGSPTFLSWYGVHLSESNRKMVYVPEGFAHGFQALSPGCEFTYQVSKEYAPEAERQIHCDEPRIGIQWPIEEKVLSPKDSSIELLDDSFEGVRLS